MKYVIEYRPDFDLNEYLQIKERMNEKVSIEQKKNIIHQMIDIVKRLHSKEVAHHNISLESFRINSAGFVYLTNFINASLSSSNEHCLGFPTQNYKQEYD